MATQDFPPDIQRLLGSAIEKWHLELDGQVWTSASGIVAMVRRSDERLALKILRPELIETATASARALAHYQGAGAVRLIDHDEACALLLERAEPGHTLAGREGREDDAMLAQCGVIAALHQAPASGSGFQSLADLGSGFGRYAPHFADRIPPPLVDRARALFADLVASQTNQRLLHGDLHRDNIVFDEGRGWLAIDPHGLFGEPAFEVEAALRNRDDHPPWSVTPALVERRVAIAVEYLNLDRSRVLGWAIVNSVLLAIWSAAEGLDPAGFVLTAEAAQLLQAKPRRRKTE